MAGVGNKILAADYNAIQSIAESVLGVGSGQYGYGQAVVSNQVLVGQPFYLNDWVALRSDLLKIGAHQTGNALEGDSLIIPGNLDPRNVTSFISKTGTGPFLVTFGFSANAVAPSVGSPYKINGCTNTNYNGVYYATASSTSQITLSYPSDPGIFPINQGAGDIPTDTVSSVKISSVLTDALRAQYLAYAQDKYIKAHKPTITIEGTTNTTTTMSSSTAQIIMLNGTISGPGIPANTKVNQVLPGTALILSNATTSTVSGGTFVVTLETGVKTVAANQLSPNEPITSVTRTAAWNGTIQAIATYTFPTQDSARAFFNSGSQVEFNFTLNGSFGSASILKDQTWQTMFNQMGIVAFRANDCIQTPTDYSPTPSTHYPIGWFELTTSDRLVFSKQSPAGAYSNNVLNIFARKDATSTLLIITVRFQDDATATPPWGIDENVDGVLSINFTATRASGLNVSVVVPPLSVTPIA